MLSFNVKIHFHHMSDQRNIVGNISITVDGMLHCTCSNTKVYNILRCVFIHQSIDDATYECISTTDTVKDMECQAFALIGFSV